MFACRTESETNNENLHNLRHKYKQSGAFICPDLPIYCLGQNMATTSWQFKTASTSEL